MILELTDYQTFKDFVLTRNAHPQCLVNGTVRILVATDGTFSIKTRIEEGSSDYTDFVANIEALSNKPIGSITDAFNSKVLADGRKLFKRHHGMGKLTLLAGEVGDFDFEIPYAECKMEGISIMDQIEEIQADLFIEDRDRLPLNQFGYEVEIPKNSFEKISKYESDLFSGMWVVLQITNTSLVTQTIRANIELNEVV